MSDGGEAGIATGLKLGHDHVLESPPADPTKLKNSSENRKRDRPCSSVAAGQARIRPSSGLHIYHVIKFAFSMSHAFLLPPPSILSTFLVERDTLGPIQSYIDHEE